MIPKQKRKSWALACIVCGLCCLNFYAGTLVGVQEPGFVHGWGVDIHPLFLKMLPLVCLYASYLLFAWIRKKDNVSKGVTDENSADRG